MVTGGFSARGNLDAREVGERPNRGVLSGDNGNQRIDAILHLGLRRAHIVERVGDLNQGLRRFHIRPRWKGATGHRDEQENDWVP